MNVRMKGVALVMLVLSIFVTGDLRAGNGAKMVEVNGDRISVQAKGVPLGQLLIAVKDLTGVHFGFDELMAKKETFLDFKDLPLSEGIKKMVFPLNCAMIYDETGKLRKVVILGRGKYSGIGEPREVENRASERYQRGSPHTSFSTLQGGSDISDRSRVHPSTEGPLQFHDPPADRKKAEDGPPVQQEQFMEGPPLNRSYSVDGPPKTENQESPGPPDAGSTDNSPPPDLKSAVMEGPPGTGGLLEK